MEALSKEMLNCFDLLGFKNPKCLPSLKEVRKAYYNMSKNIHPDKHNTEEEEMKKKYEEEFKNLSNAYTEVSKYIIENHTEEEEEEEEVMERNFFQNFMVMTLNQMSATFSIPKEHTDSWIEVLSEAIGVPMDQTSTNNGLQFKDKSGTNI